MEAPPRQPSDQQLLAHHNEADELAVWHVLTGNTAEIAPQVEGEKVFPGWVPDPSIDGVLDQPGP